MSDKTLILMVGLPKAGKTTKALKSKHPIVGSDAIKQVVNRGVDIPENDRRIEIFTKTMVKTLFSAGHETVILDDCNETKQKRDKWISEDWSREFDEVKTNKKTCLSRTEDEKVKEKINEMAEIFEPVSEEEKSQ